MIEIENLTKKYKSLVAVDNLSLRIKENECFALLGLNGAGKTTLINMLSTVLLPTSGTAKIGGFDIIKNPLEVRKIINISPQETAVAKNLTVRENLDFIASLYNITDKEEKINNIISKLQLQEKANIRCKNLSGGQMRRVSLALGLISQPKVLFLDEPTLGLDIKARKILWETISSLKGKMTIILTTHYLEEVENLADRVGIISHGKIKCVGSIEEILKNTEAKNLEDAFLSITEEEV